MLIFLRMIGNIKYCSKHIASTVNFCLPIYYILSDNSADGKVIVENHDRHKVQQK